MRKQIVIGALALVIGLWGVMHFAGESQYAYMQGILTDTVVPTLSPTATPTAAPTVTPIPQELLILTYSEVLKASKDAVAEVHETVNSVITLVGVIFSALALVGVGGTWLLSSYAQRASEKASNAQQEAARSHEVMQQIHNKSQELESRNENASENIERLNRDIETILAQFTSAHNELETLRSDLIQVKRDRQAIKRPLAQMQIDDYAMRLFAEDGMQKANALLALLEMSTRDDAIIRRRCAKVFGALDIYSERVVERLQEMMISDKARGVRLEAEEALNRIQSKISS